MSDNHHNKIMATQLPCQQKINTTILPISFTLMIIYNLDFLEQIRIQLVDNKKIL